MMSYRALLIISLSTLCAAQSSTPSLGDYARTVRKTKATGASSAKVYDNDNLPSAASLSVVGAPTSQSSDSKTHEANSKPEAQGDQKAAEKKPAGEIKPGQTPEERQQAYAVWKEKIEGQKRSVDLATRELNVVQGEYRLHTAQYYSDAGARLRNQKEWDADDAKYKQEIQDKQKALESARTKLEDLEEQARKAGVPDSEK